MGELRLFAIGIDEARDMFAATAGLAERLQATAQPLYPPPPRKRRMLDKLGPLTRTSLLPDPTVPMPGDADDLLSGRFVRPDRTPAAWVLIEHWLGDLSWGVYDIAVTVTSLDAWDFALARAGLSSTYGIAQLFNEELGFPVRPLPDMHTGYVRHAHVLATAQALAECRDRIEGEPVAWTDGLLGWLGNYPGWTRDAEASGRPQPDLIALVTQETPVPPRP